MTQFESKVSQWETCSIHSVMPTAGFGLRSLAFDLLLIYYDYTWDSCLGLTIYFASNSNWVKVNTILQARNRTQHSPPHGLLCSLGGRSGSHMLSLCPCLMRATTMRSKVTGGTWGCSVGRSGSGTLRRGVDLNSFGLRRALYSDLLPEL